MSMPTTSHTSHPSYPIKPPHHPHPSQHTHASGFFLLLTFVLQSAMLCCVVLSYMYTPLSLVDLYCVACIFFSSSFLSFSYSMILTSLFFCFSTVDLYHM
ncbi:hypothetical protein CPC08DRAFT_303296 [Agrocybe pediades]|nr:hypothetical protein CPC08DRAFT_303296 [Agrocybe pediades]